MRVLIAPDKFAGTMSSEQVVAAAARGWLRQRPQDAVTGVVLSDGGPGFLPAVASAVGGTTNPVSASGPRGEPATAEVLIHGSDAYIESAQVCGLHLLPDDQRNPAATTTAGLGGLIRAAVAAGSRTITVGLGGSGTNDGGAGALAALGATATTADGTDCTGLLGHGGGALPPVAAVDLSAPLRLLAGIDLVVATDVTAPLLGPEGAACGYAAQKGADPAQVLDLERAMRRWAVAVAEGGGRARPDDAGAGAAGGLGYGLMAVGGRAASGIGLVTGLAGLGRRCAEADLIITGEGKWDWQSAQGKVVSGVAAAAMAEGKPVLVVAGQVEVPRREWSRWGVADAASTADTAGSAAAAIADPEPALSRTCELLAQRFTHRGRQ